MNLCTSCSKWSFYFCFVSDEDFSNPPEVSDNNDGMIVSDDRDQHNLHTPDDRKKTQREPKSKKARKTILETPHHEAVVNGNSNESSWLFHFFFTNSLL